MSNQYLLYDKILIDKLKEDDKTAFTIIFSRYYSDLVHFSFNYIHEPDASEEIVQEVFLKLWENRHSLEIESSLKSYLLKSVQNRSIDFKRHRQIRQKYTSHVLENPYTSERDTENYVLHSELEQKLNSTLDKIPDDISEPFILSRFEGMNYAKIAENLGVSVRTIEVRIGKALGILRQELKDFLS